MRYGNSIKFVKKFCDNKLVILLYMGSLSTTWLSTGGFFYAQVYLWIEPIPNVKQVCLWIELIMVINCAYHQPTKPNITRRLSDNPHPCIIFVFQIAFSNWLQTVWSIWTLSKSTSLQPLNNYLTTISIRLLWLPFSVFNSSPDQ